MNWTSWLKWNGAIKVEDKSVKCITYFEQKWPVELVPWWSPQLNWWLSSFHRWAKVFDWYFESIYCTDRRGRERDQPCLVTCSPYDHREEGVLKQLQVLRSRRLSTRFIGPDENGNERVSSWFEIGITHISTLNHFSPAWYSPRGSEKRGRTIGQLKSLQFIVERTSCINGFKSGHL